MAGAPLGSSNYLKGRRWRDAIKRALRKRSRSDQIEALDDLAEMLLKKCDEGDLQALKELGDRLDGKSHQTSEVTVNRVTNLEELPTDELERIALGSGEGVASEAGGVSEHSAVH